MGVEYRQGGRQQYGPYEVEKRASAEYCVAGVRQQLVQVVNYDDLPVPTPQDAVNGVIPANSLIVAAYTYEVTAFDSTSGATTLDVGLQEGDGTEIDNDGIDAGVITADGTAQGWTVGDGALVGATVGAAPAYVVVTPSTADLTAGKGYVVIEYIEVPTS